MSKIETGVDKLVELVNAHEKLSVEEAAKKLGVSPVVIQEWADFLEEEKIISIEYKFSKTILVQRKLSQKEIKEKSKEFRVEKDAFIRKVENNLHGLDVDTQGLQKIKQEFDKIKKEIGKELYHVEDEVKELEKFESLKNGLENKLEEQQAEFHKVLDSADLQLRIEEKKYRDLLQKLDIEKRKFVIKEKQLETLEAKEEALKQKIKAIFELARSVHGKVETEKHDIEGTESRIKEIERLTDSIEVKIKKKKEEIHPMIEKSKAQSNKVLTLQQDILEKVKKSTKKINKEIKESEIVTSKFREFFDKKSEVTKIIKDLDAEQTKMEDELQVLIKKAKAYRVATKSADLTKDMAQLEDQLKGVEKEKDKFKKQLGRLIKLVKG